MYIYSRNLLGYSLPNFLNIRNVLLFHKIILPIILIGIYFLLAKYTEIKPLFIGINSSYVAIASNDEVLLWHYHTPKVNNISKLSAVYKISIKLFLQSSSTLHGVKARKEKRFHIEDTPTGVEMAKDLVNTTASSSSEAAQSRDNPDPICAIALSEKLLLVARESGIINEYSVPTVALRNRHKTGSKVYKMAINCNSR